MRYACVICAEMTERIEAAIVAIQSADQLFDRM